MSTNTTRNKRQKITSSSTATSRSIDSSQTQSLWPKNNPSTKQFPEGGLLNNLDQYIWDALAHIDPQRIETLFNTKGKRKQVAIREALNIIDMGWVGTNETPYRKAVGALFDEAVKVYERNGWNSGPKHTLPKITTIKVEDVEWKASKLNSSVELNDGIIKIGRTSNECIFSNRVSDSIKASIDQTGMVLLHNAVDKSTIQTLLTGKATSNSHPDATQIKVQPKVNKLLYTSGNGKEGYYNDIQDNKYLNRLQDIIISSLKGMKETMSNTSDKRKYILLNYSEGGENWAHRDSNKDDDYFPYQGLLMLSNSTDYDGGEFYVAKRCDNDDTNGKKKKQHPSVIRTYCPKLDAGDLILFQASKEGGYDHGMKTVTRGERVAIGLLQPVPK